MKTELKKFLSRVEDFEDPKISLEQYMTPPALAADLIHSAEMQGSLDGKVVDLGTGTGILTIGAALLGAEVTAVEKDEDALEASKKNAKRIGVQDKIKFLEKDVKDIEEDFDTVLMNPPFSQHSEEGMEFWKKATEIGDRVYAVSPSTGREGIKSFIASSNHRVVELEEFKISLPATYGFHTQENRETKVDLIITEVIK